MLNLTPIWSLQMQPICERSQRFTNLGQLNRLHQLVFASCVHHLLLRFTTCQAKQIHVRKNKTNVFFHELSLRLPVSRNPSIWCTTDRWITSSACTQVLQSHINGLHLGFVETEPHLKVLGHGRQKDCFLGFPAEESTLPTGLEKMKQSG